MFYKMGKMCLAKKYGGRGSPLGAQPIHGDAAKVNNIVPFQI
jgi:hypothetical protein